MSNNQLVQTVGTKRTTSLLRSFFFVFPDDDDLVWWMTSTCTDPIDSEHTVANRTCVCVWPTDSHSQGDGDEIGKIVGKETDFPQTYLLCGDVLPSVLECKDLGITVDSTLSFTGHICNIVAKAKLRSSQILRFFLSKDPQVLTKAFVVYVRPNTHLLSGLLLLLLILISWSQCSAPLLEGFQDSKSCPMTLVWKDLD